MPHYTVKKPPATTNCIVVRDELAGLRSKYRKRMQYLKMGPEICYWHMRDHITREDLPHHRERLVVGPHTHTGQALLLVVDAEPHILSKLTYR